MEERSLADLKVGHYIRKRDPIDPQDRKRDQEKSEWW